MTARRPSKKSRKVRARGHEVGIVDNALAGTTHGAGQYATVEYPASTAENELQVGVTYTLWIPEGVKTLRGVIVHQHGAGTTASREGATAAYDLHWQALAKKWDCALLGPTDRRAKAVKFSGP